MDSFEKLREGRGLKITETCDLVGISRSIYYSIKDKGQPVSDKVMSRVLDALDPAKLDATRSSSSPNYWDSTPVPSIQVSEMNRPLSEAEVRVLVAEIKIRLDMIEMSYSARDEK